MKMFNIYLSGVGGQGIGLLSEMILRAADHAGHNVRAVDTHGLAQRGGIVVSQIRMGTDVHTPLVPARQADLVVSLERHEAMRALVQFAKPGSTLIYYNTVWQPLDVRMGNAEETEVEEIHRHCKENNIRLLEIFEPDLADVRMQNVVLLANLEKAQLVPGVNEQHYLQAMDDLMAGRMLDVNRELFNSLRKAA